MKQDKSKNRHDINRDGKNGHSNPEKHHEHHKHHKHDSHSVHQEQNHNHNHDHSSHHRHMIEDFKKRFWITLLLTLPILLLAPMIQEFIGYEFRFTGDRYVQFILSSLVFFYGGYPFLKGLFDEIKKRKPGMMTLISLAISVAYIYSSAVVLGLGGKIFFWELATLIGIMLLGHWIEMKSILGASNALHELAEMMPKEARRIKENGESEDVPISELRPNDIILVRPGEKIPADGYISEGESHLNESMLTGESMPVNKTTGDEVIGGSINNNGSLKIKVKSTGEDSYLSKVIEMVKSAQSTKSKTQNLANRAAGWLFYVAISAGLITIITWLAIGKEFEYALERMVTVMIISCPHALGLAVPLVVAISTALAAKKGLLIRNRTAFENSGRITTIIFDKTGTLTKGEFGITRFKSISKDYNDEEILKIAASLESNSEHPIGSGVTKKANDLNIDNYDISDFSNITGKGITANINNNKVSIVSPGYLKENKIEIPKEALNDNSETVIFVLSDDSLIGYIALADEIREESLSAVNMLKEKGIKVFMATGDNDNVAKTVSEKLGLDKYYSEVLPEDKQQIIRELQSKGEFVAMTGDGVNDAPALAQANVGIAVGSGTDIAAETADIILVNSNPQDISSLILFGSATYKKMVQNLFWAAGYNIVAVPLAAGVLASVGIILSPAIGAVLMSLSTVVVALNAQLLKRKMI